MDLDKLIKDGYVIKGTGYFAEDDKIVGKYDIVVKEDISSEKQEIKKLISRHTGTFIIIQSVKTGNYDIISYDSFEEAYRQSELKYKELKALNTGDTLIDRYFKKHGIMFKKQAQEPSTTYNWHPGAMPYEFKNIHIWHDGKSTPNSGWNTTIYSMGITSQCRNSNNSYAKNGYVNQISVELYRDNYDLIEMTEVNGEPVLRDCHGSRTNLHEKYDPHYTTEQWNAEIDSALDFHITKVRSLFDENKPILKNKEILYQEGADFLIDFEDPLKVFQMQKLDAAKYRNAGTSISKIPKFLETITLEEVLNAIRTCFEKMVEDARKPFKY